MTFTEYPTREDRKKGTNGVQLDGEVISAAPGGAKWVLTTPDKRWHLVRTRLGVSTAIAGERP